MTREVIGEPSGGRKLSSKLTVGAERHFSSPPCASIIRATTSLPALRGVTSGLGAEQPNVANNAINRGTSNLAADMIDSKTSTLLFGPGQGARRWICPPTPSREPWRFRSPATPASDLLGHTRRGGSSSTGFRNQHLLRFLQYGHQLVSPNCREVVQKSVKILPRFQIVDEGLHGHTSTGKDRSSPEDPRRLLDDRLGHNYHHCTTTRELLPPLRRSAWGVGLQHIAGSGLSRFQHVARTRPSWLT